MKITILAAAALNIKESLNSLLPGNTIKAFETIENMHEFVLNSTLRTDVLLVEDYGITKNQTNLNDSFMILVNVLRYPFFKTKRVIFLNKPNNVNWLNYYNYLKEDLEEKEIEVIISTKKHTISDIKNMVLELNKEYKTVKANDVIVVQKARGSELETTQMIEKDESDVAITTILPQYNRKRAKEPFKNNLEPINISEIPGEVPEIIIEDDFSIEVEEETKDKYVIVTGAENSGVSTTSFIMAESGTEFGKVLLVDMDIHNMGLSYLADKIYSKLDSVHILKLEDVYTKSFDNLVNQTMNSDNCHILTISLKLIKKVEDIEFTLINFIEKVKERYDYIIFDAPIRVLKYYPILLGSYVDRIILTCIPYMNKLVSAFNQTAQSNIVSMKAFRENKIAIFSVGIAERNGLKPVSREISKKYAKAILKTDIPVSGIYQLNSQGYFKPKFFEDLMSLHSQTKDTANLPEDYGKQRDSNDIDILDNAVRDIETMINPQQPEEKLLKDNNLIYEQI